jgi:hypothetical protein
MITNIPIWQSLLSDAAMRLQLKIDSFCVERNEKESPRYFHADVGDAKQSATKWRMKVVNQSRDDWEAVQNCNSYNNSVHARLINANALRKIVLLPEHFNLPSEFWEQYNLSELIHGNVPSTRDFELIVEVLVNVQLNRGEIVQQLKREYRAPWRQIDETDYRQRVEDSLRGLTGIVDSGRIRRGFKVRWFPGDIPADIKTFAHGDFSFGNLKLVGQTIALIDFEHSHIGLGCVDVAHLYVNLFANGRTKDAATLRQLYETKILNHNLWFQDKIFEALIIERITGKMNSIKDRTRKEFSQLKDLLNSFS